MTEDNFRKLPALNLPMAQQKIYKKDDKLLIYDKIRRKVVTLTPEEWVRQNFVNWLTGYLHYPISLMANEVTLTVNDTSKRCDTVAFGLDGSPLLIVEYKAPGIEITQDVFDQIYRYNLKFKADYLCVSNGLKHYCCKIDYDTGGYNFIKMLPDFRDIQEKGRLN